jgi:hypothetical protein
MAPDSYGHWLAQRSADETHNAQMGFIVIAVLFGVFVVAPLLYFLARIAWIILSDKGARRSIARAILFLVLLSICLPFHIFGVLVFLIAWFGFLRPAFRRSDAIREIKKQIRERMESESYSTGQYVPIYGRNDEMVATYDPETGKFTAV